MKKLIILAFNLKFIIAFGQNDCKFCDSVLQLQRQTGNPNAMSKYNSSCFKRDTIYLDSIFNVTSKAICSDLVLFSTYYKKNNGIRSTLKVENKDTIYSIADKMPRYPSGEMGMMKFIQN
jgi:hypothetical protein